VQDVWVAEVREFQPVFSFVKSDRSGVSQEAPMPVNWLSEIRDLIRSLKSSNDFQKDECF
jgi:hypothetical protein